MQIQDWVGEFFGSVMVCDPQGIVLGMNKAAEKAYEKDGGAKLIGANALDCHPQPSRKKFEDMLASGQKNIYSVERNGVKKLVIHAPWYQDGQYAGFVEILMEVPPDMPHFVRA